MSEYFPLCYTGKIVDIQPISGADFIVSATVVCGKGGEWQGVVKKSDLQIDNLCTVFLPDALIPEMDEMRFMESSGWRVRMRRFKGAASEVVMVPLMIQGSEVGFDCTDLLGVTKYFKPIPESLSGEAKGEFPSFIPKANEDNYQCVPRLVKQLIGKSYYITEKADGSTSTCYKYNGEFEVCSRNWKLIPHEHNGYWKVAYKYNLKQLLPEGIAFQWETCGPGIQSNPMGLNEFEGFAFSAYNIPERRYLCLEEFLQLCDELNFPVCPLIEIGNNFNDEGIEKLGEGTYSNGKQREGVVIRSWENELGHKPISFKVINLNYDN